MLMSIHCCLVRPPFWMWPCAQKILVKSADKSINVTVDLNSQTQQWFPIIKPQIGGKQAVLGTTYRKFSFNPSTWELIDYGPSAEAEYVREREAFSPFTCSL